MDQNERSALERVVGHVLRASQQIIVNVVDIEADARLAKSARPADQIPEFWKTYEGLSDQEIDELDKAI